MKDTGTSYDKKDADNPGQNIWDKVNKPSKIGEDQKTLVSPFEYFLTVPAKVFMSQPNFETFLVFPDFLIC